MGRKSYRNETFSRLYEDLFYSRGPVELSKLLKVSRTTLNSWKSGDSFPDPGDLVNIARHLNVSVDYLLGLTPFNSIDGEMQSASRITGLTEDTIRAINGEELDGHLVNILNKMVQQYDADGNMRHYLYDIAEALKKALTLTATDIVGQTAKIGDVDTGLKSGEMMRMYCNDIGNVFSRLVLDYLIDDVIRGDLDKEREAE